MLPLLVAVLALAAAPGAVLSQQAEQVPAEVYGPPQAYSAPAPAAAGPELTALTADNAAYTPYAYSYSEPGFSVQTGYEGYLVPYQGHSVPSPGALGLLAALLPLPKLGLKLFPKVGLFLLGFLFLLLIGGAFTTAVCAFTPFCTISFLGLGLTRNTMRSYLTPDRLTQTTAFVLDAIDKYKDFSKKVSKEAKEARSKDSKRRRR
ncbi:Formate--tetrahydrofolate ligase [Frankliniella fusca]|uniref:Formate--tetrahydrofolate ligase n=1 Tax=Frankliniella fusca TaxID=407009 RepID=A0AAE1L8U5_9NEOP|nr:Formate--tetrahydrofolate ligase [Frankliniella fusca]